MFFGKWVCVVWVVEWVVSGGLCVVELIGYFVGVLVFGVCLLWVSLVGCLECYIEVFVILCWFVGKDIGGVFVCRAVEEMCVVGVLLLCVDCWVGVLLLVVWYEC